MKQAGEMGLSYYMDGGCGSRGPSLKNLCIVNVTAPGLFLGAPGCFGCLRVLRHSSVSSVYGGLGAVVLYALLACVLARRPQQGKAVTECMCGLPAGA